jgi:hypothetical protein
MPNTMPTPCIDGLLPVSTWKGVIGCNLFTWNTLSKPISMPMPIAKLLIFLVILVRDQEAGGSNPLAPTNFFTN